MVRGLFLCFLFSCPWRLLSCCLFLQIFLFSLHLFALKIYVSFFLVHFHACFWAIVNLNEKRLPILTGACMYVCICVCVGGRAVSFFLHNKALLLLSLLLLCFSLLFLSYFILIFGLFL
ncbi:hypothetical protein C8Q69DRAFT_323147 [Paecilomyces variotii]|uniref:Uncharacterized protein n=1 Tax=Byssochlamys spectabilis TaxID=264951 RepID=A0A443HR88_BYSSP|nr:hypothetical protein C8Q69DRAFT_323147 [Paecilomyces variotii]RWQ94304.1 hypothetical protein C8Q69DRAFT_323147 [Paecilomyces variotii]